MKGSSALLISGDMPIRKPSGMATMHREQIAEGRRGRSNSRAGCRAPCRSAPCRRTAASRCSQSFAPTSSGPGIADLPCVAVSPISLAYSGRHGGDRQPSSAWRDARCRGRRRTARSRRGRRGERREEVIARDSLRSSSRRRPGPIPRDLLDRSLSPDLHEPSPRRSPRGYGSRPFAGTTARTKLRRPLTTPS